MFIHNPNELKNVYKTNSSIVYNYLKSKVPVLSIDNGYFYFAQTDKLNQVLKEAPFWVKVVTKCKR